MIVRAAHIVLTTTFLLGVFSLSAQQYWLFNQHQFNVFDVNHAYAGDYEDLAIGLRYRSQWAGVDGAPDSFNGSAHVPIGNSLGAGASFRSDRIGAHDWTVVRLAAAYKLDLGGSKLSFALSPGMWNQQFDIDRISARDQDDEFLASGIASQSAFTVDFSAMFRTSTFLVGVQANNMNQPKIEYYSNSQSLLSRHLDVILEYSWVMSKKHVLKPVVLARWTPNASPSADISLQYFWNQTLWLGAGYRLGSTAFALLEWQINDNIRLGYSYDLFAPSDVGLVNSQGSNEVFLGINVLGESTQTPSIRYFR